MTIIVISRILKNHNIPFYVKNSRIYADSMCGGTEIYEEVIDVTDYSRAQLYEWLGY